MGSSNCADDTKLISGVGSEEEVDRLREDLRILFTWWEDWQMAFNVDKCSVVYILDSTIMVLI